MIDFHSHILPGMDDGCETVEESIEVIKEMIKQGTHIVCATPHYVRRKESVESFLKRRKASEETLYEKLKKENIDIKIIPGAEVEFFRGMSQTDLSDLCFDKTKYILIEMPFRKWGDADFAELDRIILNQGVAPILAHIDRYVRYKNRLGKIKKLTYPLQVNAEAFLHYRKYVSLIRTRNGIVVGSDSHNNMIRGPNMHIAERAIGKYLGEEKLSQIEKTGKTILNLKD